MGYALSIQTQLKFITEECCTCHVMFAMTEDFYDRATEKKEGHPFFCPNGHRQCYLGETEAQKLKKQLATAQAETERQRQLRIAADKREIAQRAQVTRLKNRAHAGVCVHCNRTFKQLAAHMKAKHADEIQA